MKHRGAIPEPANGRGIYLATPSAEIAKRAQALGASVKKELVESASRVDLKKQSIDYTATIETYYLLRFENTQVSKIAQDFSLSAPPRSFEEGLKQIEHDFLSPF